MKIEPYLLVSESSDIYVLLKIWSSNIKSSEPRYLKENYDIIKTGLLYPFVTQESFIWHYLGSKSNLQYIGGCLTSDCWMLIHQIVLNVQNLSKSQKDNNIIQFVVYLIHIICKYK